MAISYLMWLRVIVINTTFPSIVLRARIASNARSRPSQYVHARITGLGFGAIGVKSDMNKGAARCGTKAKGVEF